MGVKLKLSGVTLTGTPAPLRNDLRLTAGSLILEDFTSADVAAGVPANGSTIYNVAWNEAAALIGSGNAATLASTFTNTFTSAQGIFERTTKGALHGVVSRTAQGGNAASITGAQAIANYIAANPTREYALFLWAEITRVASSISNMRDWSIGSNVSMATNYLFNDGFPNTAIKQRLGLQKVGWSGTPSGTPSFNVIEQAWGNTGAYNFLNANDGKSYVLYQRHFVDVAASGLTFAQLDALDAAQYAVFNATGGRHFGDTYTAAATLIAS